MATTTVEQIGLQRLDSAASRQSTASKPTNKTTPTPPGLSPQPTVDDLIAGGGENEREVANLPPPDRGRAAWTILAAVTVIELIVWGLPYSIGILHKYWVHDMFPNSESTVTLASMLHNGMLLVGVGLCGP